MSRFVERKVSGLTVKIDRGSCIASANCINAAPDFFEFDDDRICAFKEMKDRTENKKILKLVSFVLLMHFMFLMITGNR